MHQAPSHPPIESFPVTARGPQMGDLTMPMAASMSAHVGQATAVEQSRAAAEVQSAVVVAQRFPRNERYALGRIVSACSRLSLAKEAFFSFPRGGEVVTGASVKLARELARSWGNIQYEIVELSQDLKRGESEVMAYAWDLETNTRSAIRFIVPHIRHTKNGEKRLTDPRDVYELIANNGSRRLRQCILAVMPADVVTEAERVCRETLKKGDGISLDERIKKCVVAFRQIGVSREMLLERLGHDPGKMSIDDLTDLQIIFQSIKAGESVEEFFSREEKKQGQSEKAENKTGSQLAEPSSRNTKSGKEKPMVSTKEKEPKNDAPVAVEKPIPASDAGNDGEATNGDHAGGRFSEGPSTVHNDDMF
ncbi:MAG: hypothetical protein HQL85_18725 [Magnetococcales bacterium]|nr:hypothetical protein [Magnetococcales bacterium]